MQTVDPFSNGTEVMVWQEHNCERCKKAFYPKEGEDWPDYKETLELIKQGKECPMKLSIELGFGADIPMEHMEKIGYSEEEGISWDCKQRA